MKSACAQRRQTECRVRLSEICNFISRLKRWPTGIFQSNPVVFIMFWSEILQNLFIMLNVNCYVINVVYHNHHRIFQLRKDIKYILNNQKQIIFYNSVGMFVYKIKIQQTGKRVDSEQKCRAQPDKVPLSRVYCKSWSGSQFYLFYKPSIFWNLLQGKERVI